MKPRGKITKILANFYYVQDTEGKLWECFARARLLKEGKILLAGDEVEIEISNSKQGVIVDLINRKNKILKPPIANIDQVLVIFSTCEPDFDFYNLDRYLSFVRHELPNEKITICINKIDLKKINIDKAYKNSSFQIFYISALTKEGLDDLACELPGKTTVLTGPSGVGKSSLIKALCPSADVKVGDLGSIKQGKHITRNVQLISTHGKNKQGFLIDTPGFTQIDFSGIKPHKILETFKELNNTGCSFSNCLHNGEEGCILQEKDLPKSRIESYLKILDEALSKKIYSIKEESKFKTEGSKLLPKIDQEKRAKSRKREKQGLSRVDEDIESM